MGLGLLFLFGLASAFSPRAIGACETIRFAGPPKVYLHAKDLGDADLTAVAQAMKELHRQFNNLGVPIRVTSLELTTEPFVYQQWFKSPEPAIHVGFSNEPGIQPAATAWKLDRETCTYDQAHIRVKHPDVYDAGWAFEEPGADIYYTVGLNSPSGERYFRVAYLHELLHAFGLAHSNDGFAMLNYRDRTWLNRQPGHRLKPLPDDIRGIETLYGPGQERQEVGLLNSWWQRVRKKDKPYPAASQRLICEPAVGTGWEAWSKAQCASNGSQAVCPGDRLRARVAVVNYGTSAIEAGLTAHFSTDLRLSGGDVQATTDRRFTIAKESSRQVRGLFRIPATLPFSTEFTVILSVQGDAIEREWIPLRGTIRTRSAAECR